MGLSDILAAILGIFKRAPETSAPAAPAPAPATASRPAVSSGVPLLTPALLSRALGIPLARATLWAIPLSAAMAHYQIDTAGRQTAFLAQVGHESGRLVFVKELWGPTAAQELYEPPTPQAKALGNTQPGDGERYCGRGLIQITGRYNYGQCGAALELDLIADPSLLEQPSNAAMSAGWFWDVRNLNALADAGDFTTLTQRINGGTNGLADRVMLLTLAKGAFASPEEA